MKTKNNYLLFATALLLSTATLFPAAAASGNDSQEENGLPKQYGISCEKFARSLRAFLPSARRLSEKPLPVSILDKEDTISIYDVGEEVLYWTTKKADFKGEYAYGMSKFSKFVITHSVRGTCQDNQFVTWFLKYKHDRSLPIPFPKKD